MIDDARIAGTGEIGPILRSIRKSRNLSQEALGRILDCTQNTVSRYEAGRSVPSVRRLRSILDLAESESETRVILACLIDMGAVVSCLPATVPVSEGANQ